MSPEDFLDAGTVREEAPSKKFLEEAIGESFLPGNAVQVLIDGGPAFSEFFKAVEEATCSVCLEYYIFRDDETGWSLAELLSRKTLEGVSVRLIYDHFGSFSTSSRFWKFLKSHGVEVRPFHAFQWMTPGRYFHRDHRKLAVIDGWTAVTGGLNVGDEYRGYLRKRLAGWRDTAVMIRGPAAQVLLGAFEKSWREVGGKALRGVCGREPMAQEQGADVLPLLSSSRKSMRALRHLLQLSVHAAKRSIHLTMAYFIPTRGFLLPLLAAARRGVEVTVILPGWSDLGVVTYVTRTYYQTLLSAGVKIFLYQPRVLHAKTMIFDGSWSIVGSANLDARSLNYNYECGVGILNPGLGREMEKIFLRDLEDSVQVTEADLGRWPLHERALGAFLSWFHSYL